jgi:hypothetical protein
LAIEFIQLLLKPWCTKALSYGLDQAIELTAGLLQHARFCGHGEFGIVALPVEFGMKFPDEFSNKIGTSGLVRTSGQSQNCQTIPQSLQTSADEVIE